MAAINNPIGVFDSGIGGVSVLKEMLHVMPEENFIYYGDSANAPYGTKPLEDIIRLSENCADYLLGRGCKAIVIACNTATGAAAELLRAKHPEIPIIGIEPALKPAALWKEHDRVAVMATPMTLSQSKFLNLLHTYEDISTIYSVPCPDLVKFVERGELEGADLEAYLHTLLDDVLAKGLDAIVLGCTHYPFVEGAIKNVVGPDVGIFVGSHGTAMELKRRLEVAGLKLPEGGPKGSVEIVNSSTDPKQLTLCKMLLEL